VVCVLALSHVYLVFLLPRSTGPAGAEGLAMFLLFFVLVNDAFQWLAGKLFGRTKIAPRLSPNKTWEGLLGGLAVNVALAVPFGRAVLPLGAAAVAGLAAALSVLGFVGDIYVSAIKRDLGVKDTGAVIPGQGGILDRSDSLVLNAPLYAWAAWAWALAHGAG
jgi:phosphatidate cytidylyltransferase